MRIFGYELFGHILPFIGFRDLEVSDEMCEDLGYEPGDKVSFFCLEWLGYGWGMTIASPRRDD